MFPLETQYYHSVKNVDDAVGACHLRKKRNLKLTLDCISKYKTPHRLLEVLQVKNR